MSDPTDAITIRVPKSLKTSLEEMSKKNQVNLNLQINQILNKTVEWNEHVTKMGCCNSIPPLLEKFSNY